MRLRRGSRNAQTYNHSNFHTFTDDMTMRAVRYRTKLELISNPRIMSSLGVGPDLARLFKRDKTLHKMTNFGTQPVRRTTGRIVCQPIMQELTGTALEDLRFCIDRFAMQRLDVDFDSETTPCQWVISAEVQVNDTHTGESRYDAMHMHTSMALKLYDQEYHSRTCIGRSRVLAESLLYICLFVLCYMGVCRVMCAVGWFSTDLKM